MVITIYDNGGNTIDRYTVEIDDDVYTMSADPLSPQGVNHWADSKSKLNKDEPEEEDRYIGKSVPFSDLPDPVKRAIAKRVYDSEGECHGT